MNFDSSKVLSYCQGLFPPIWYSKCIPKQIDLWLTPDAPSMTFDPNKVWSGIRPAKSGGHRELLNKYIAGRSKVIPAWALTPTMHYTLVRGSFSDKIWQPYGISETDWSLDVLCLLIRSDWKCYQPRGPHHTLLKHDKTQSRSYTLTNTLRF